jgi:hypothetical protein
LENSPSKLPFFPSPPESAESLPPRADSERLARNPLILERLGMLEDTVERMLDLSRVTPASTRNSFADGSRFSKLDE